ncbi:MAG: ABC transporter permease [Myxococcales bacterium]|nr:ABC transporter permease [Myxococcales bacterium]
MSRVLSLDFLGQAVRVALPYMGAAMGGVLSERAGIVNVALEGTMLVAALAAAWGALATGSVVVALLSAALAGALVQLVHGTAVVHGKADPIVSGLAINLLALAGTRFLLRALYASSSNSPTIPGQSASLLRDPASWVVVAVVVATTWTMTRSRFGLRIRAVGEHPEAAASVGVSVPRTQLLAVAAAGVAAGLAGAWLALDQRQFSSKMSGGRGYIALAILVLSGHRPGRAAGIALAFGAAEALELVVQETTKVPHQLVQTLPYVVTLAALVVFGARRRATAHG